MAVWNVPAKPSYTLFIAGDANLTEGARAATARVLEALSKGPPPAVELGSWTTAHARTGTVPIERLRELLASERAAGIAGDEEADLRVERATHALALAADESAALDPRAPWGLLVLGAALASASSGLAYDSGTLRIVPRWILENPLDGFMLGSIKNHVAILSSTDAANLQLTTTVGLNKYGLFELELGGIPSSAGNVGSLVAGLAQALVDARPADAGPWEVPATIDVTRFHVAHAFATELETKPGATMRLVVRPGVEDAISWQVAGPEGDLDATAVRDALVALSINPADDEAFGAAIERATRIARIRLGEARAAFARRDLTQDVVFVKKRFIADDAASEYLWLRVEDWARARVSAIVTTQTRAIANLSVGDRVTLEDDDILDWRVDRRNGESLGNFSEEALSRIRGG